MLQQLKDIDINYIKTKDFSINKSADVTTNEALKYRLMVPYQMDILHGVKVGTVLLKENEIDYKLAAANNLFLLNTKSDLSIFYFTEVQENIIDTLNLPVCNDILKTIFKRNEKLILKTITSLTSIEDKEKTLQKLVQIDKIYTPETTALFTIVTRTPIDTVILNFRDNPKPPKIYYANNETEKIKAYSVEEFLSNNSNIKEDLKVSVKELLRYQSYNPVISDIEISNMLKLTRYVVSN